MFTMFDVFAEQEPAFAGEKSIERFDTKDLRLIRLRLLKTTQVAVNFGQIATYHNFESALRLSTLNEAVSLALW